MPTLSLVFRIRLAGHIKFYSKKKDLHLSSNLSRPKPPFCLLLSTSFSLTLSIKEGVYHLCCFLYKLLCVRVCPGSEVSLWTNHCIYIKHLVHDGTGHFHHSFNVTYNHLDTFFTVNLSARFVVSVVPDSAYFDLVRKIFRPHSTIPSEPKDFGL